MTASSISRQNLKENLATRFQLSGEELEHMFNFMENNLVNFSKTISSMVTQGEWEEIQYGASRLKALGENLGWENLSAAAFALGEGAKMKNRGGIAQAHRQLRELIAAISKPKKAAPAEIRFKLD